MRISAAAAACCSGTPSAYGAEAVPGLAEATLPLGPGSRRRWCCPCAGCGPNLRVGWVLIPPAPMH